MKFLKCDNISKKLLDEIRTEKNVILYNYAEPYSLFPYLNNGGYHKRDSRALFYHLFKEFDDTHNITVVGADIHLKQNYERVKQVVDSSLNLKIVSFPWFFVHEYFFPGEIGSYFLKDNIQLPIEYNAIFLSGGKRFCRYHIISELSKYNNFIFSNLGYLEENNEKIHREILEYELLDDHFSISYFDYRSHTHNNILTSGDDEALIYLFNFNKYNSSKKIYFKPDLKKLKNPSQVALNNSSKTKFSMSELEKEYQTYPWYLYNIVCDEYLKSAVNFVCETQTDIATHITEKTIKNFFYKKPFLNFASKNYYKFLTDHGFVLYDELFDYSFDEIDQYGKRLKAYIAECERILQMDLKELTSIITTFKDKLNHNYKVCDDISYKVFKGLDDDKYQIFQDRIENYVSTLD